MTEIPTFQPKPFVFVLLPFAPEFDDIYRYGIKDACEKSGTYAEPVDEQIFQGSILERVYNQIAKADIIVADMTGRNPNVFYETGYAHPLGKPVILLTQNSEDIPFDLKHFHHIVYGGRISNLAAQLEPRLRFFADNLSMRESLRKSGISITVNEVDLLDNDVLVQVGRRSATAANIRLHIRFHNPVTQYIRSRRFQPAVTLPSIFRVDRLLGVAVNDKVAGYSLLRGEQWSDIAMVLLDEPIELLPGSFCTLTLTVQLPDRPLEVRTHQYQMSVRVFLDSVPEEYPFRVVVETDPTDAELIAQTKKGRTLKNMD